MEEKKTVFVTGASRGIGKEVALKYAEKGYDVIINYVSDKTDVEALEKYGPCPIHRKTYYPVSKYYNKMIQLSLFNDND